MRCMMANDCLIIILFRAPEQSSANSIVLECFKLYSTSGLLCSCQVRWHFECLLRASGSCLTCPTKAFLTGKVYSPVVPVPAQESHACIAPVPSGSHRKTTKNSCIV